MKKQSSLLLCTLLAAIASSCSSGGSSLASSSETASSSTSSLPAQTGVSGTESELGGSASEAPSRVTFRVVPPDIELIHGQADVVPYLRLGSEGRKFRLPQGVPIQLQDGTPIDESRLGYQGYRVDLIGGTFDGEAVLDPERIVVSDAPMATMLKYYAATVHEFGDDRYFVLDDDADGPRGMFNLDDTRRAEGNHILAGVRIVNGTCSHIAILHVLTNGGESLEVGVWDYGPIISA